MSMFSRVWGHLFARFHAGTSAVEARTAETRPDQFCEDCRHFEPAKDFSKENGGAGRVQFAKCRARTGAYSELTHFRIIKEGLGFWYCSTVRQHENPDPRWCKFYEPPLGGDDLAAHFPESPGTQEPPTTENPTSGPPTPDLAGQLDSTESLASKERAIPQTEVRGGPLAVERILRVTNQFSDPTCPKDRIRVTFEVTEEEYAALINTPLPTSGPHTYEPAYQSVNRFERSKRRIGVYDYDSLVACLRSNWEKVTEDPGRIIDPQAMIQFMAAEIQNLRYRQSRTTTLDSKEEDNA